MSATQGVKCRKCEKDGANLIEDLETALIDLCYVEFVLLLTPGIGYLNSSTLLFTITLPRLQGLRLRVRVRVYILHSF